MALWRSENRTGGGGHQEEELISLLAGAVSGATGAAAANHRHSGAGATYTADVSRPRTVSLNVTVENRTIVLAKENKEEDKPMLETEEGKVEAAKEDGGWGWVVVGASLACLCLLDGVSYSFGVLLPALSADLAAAAGGAAGRVGVAAAGSLQTGLYALAGLGVSKLVDRFGTRRVCLAGTVLAGTGLLLASFAWDLTSLYLSYSLMTGVGFGMMYIPAIVAVAEHFHRRRSLALGICVCGTGLGTFLLAPLESWSLDLMGWRWSMVLLAGLCFACTLCAAAMTPVKDEATATAADKESCQLDTTQNDRLIAASSGCWRRLIVPLVGEDLAGHSNLSVYLLVTLADAVGTVALFIPFTYLPEVAVTAGVSAESAAYLVAAGGLASSCGRILSGWLSDWTCPLALTTGAVVLAALQPILLTWCSAFPAFLLFTCLYGALTGAWIAAATPLLLKILSLHLLTPAFGLMTAVQGFAALAGTPLAALVVEYTGLQEASLILTGALLILSAILFATSYVVLRQKRRKSERRSFYTALP